MSAVKGVKRTLMDDATPTNRLKPGEFDGRMKVMVDYYEALALESGSTIDLGGTLPTGAIILEIVLMTDDLGATPQLSVGDDEDADRYIGAHICTTANQVKRINQIDGKNYEVDMTTASTPDNQMVITTSVAAITGTIKITIFYTHD